MPGRGSSGKAKGASNQYRRVERGDHTELEEMIDSEVVEAYKEAVKFGDLANGPYPSADTIFTEVYEEVPWHLQEQHDEMMGD